MKIIDRVFLKLDEQNLKSVDLANFLGVNKSVISNWKTRSTNPPSEFIVPICEFLKVDLQYLLTGSQTEIQEFEKDITPIDIVTENGFDYINLNSTYTIGDRIKVIRITKNINQKEFSDAINIEQSRLSEFESNKTKPSFDTLYSIKKTFNISLDWLMFGEGEPFINAASKNHPMLAEPNQSYESENKVSNDSTFMTIGQRIKLKRNELKLTIKQVHQLTGLSVGNISDMENNKYAPSTSSLVPLSQALKCSIDWIITGTKYIENVRESETHNVVSEFSELETDIISMYRVLNVRDQEEIFNCIYNKYKYEQNKFWEKGTSLYSTYFEESEETSTNDKQDKRKKGSGIA